MNLEIWSIGKANEPFIEEGIRYYFKKIKKEMPIQLELIQYNKKITEKTAIKKYEEELVFKKLKDYHYLILLDEKGKMLSSEDWAGHLQQCMNERTKTIVILIGGAYGVSENVQKRARQIWSLSKLVFPHQLVRLMVAEQLYRSCSILKNSPYHHS